MIARKNSLIHFYGIPWEEQERLFLKAGPLNLIYEAGDLRYIQLEEKEVIRRIYVAIRNCNWDTIPNFLSNVKVNTGDDHFQISYDVRNYNGDIDFYWKGCIRGEPDGRLIFTMEGEARKEFYKNRIGFCVLYPMKCAGISCRYEKVESAGGGTYTAVFPKWISPHQPFMDFKSFSYQTKPDLWIRLDFEGDVFEMEDQRNWTDASFKIYSTPLRNPIPVMVQKGQKICQAIRFTLEGKPSTWPKLPKCSSTRRVDESFPTIKIGKVTDHTLCHFGFCINDLINTQFEIPKSIVKKLSPSHLRLDLNLDQPDWEFKLIKGSDITWQFKVPLWLLLKTSEDQMPSNLGEMLAGLKTIPERIMITKNRLPWNTTANILDALREQMRVAGINSFIGGGTDAWFTELNRNRPPVDKLDFIFWSITPQVHAFDNTSLVENLAAQKATAISAARIAGGLPLIVSPVTLKMRFNPHATVPEIPSLSDEIPSHTEPRQWGLFGAVWTLISLKYLSEGGVMAATYYELTGPRGLIYLKATYQQPAFDGNPNSRFYPLFQVFKELSNKQGWKICSLSVNLPLLVDALALTANKASILYIANLSSISQKVRIDGLESPHLRARRKIEAYLFSEADWDEIVSHPDYEFSKLKYTIVENKILEVLLPPFSIARLKEILS